MEKTLKLHTYDGKDVYFAVENVEEIMCIYCYTISGDECAAVIYRNGDFVELDSDSGSRVMGFGPDDPTVLLPDEIEWERVPYEA